MWPLLSAPQVSGDSLAAVLAVTMITAVSGLAVAMISRDRTRSSPPDPAGHVGERLAVLERRADDLDAWRRETERRLDLIDRHHWRTDGRGG